MKKSTLCTAILTIAFGVAPAFAQAQQEAGAPATVDSSQSQQTTQVRHNTNTANYTGATGQPDAAKSRCG